MKLKSFLALTLITIFSSFAQIQEDYLVVEWHRGLWNSVIIQKRYPDWPQTSTVKIELTDDGLYYTTFNSYKKKLVLRDGLLIKHYIENPNLFKPIFLNLNPSNSFVDIRWAR